MSAELAAGGNKGEALIKPEYLVSASSASSFSDPLKSNPAPKSESNGSCTGVITDEPVIKKAKSDDSASNGDSVPESKPELVTEQVKPSRQDRKGQNKHRPGPQKFANHSKLCPTLVDGHVERACASENCPFIHDVDEYLRTRDGWVDKQCPNFEKFGKCAAGLRCAFGKSHIDKENRNIVNEELWKDMKNEYDKCHGQLITRDVQFKLRKKIYDFKETEKICNDSHSDKPLVKTLGPFTDEDKCLLRVSEFRKLDWKDKLYLSPLTTVGNLPFRRICVDFGADITCSEMSMATSIVQGNHNEFALHRRHPSEKFWGVQLCASNPWMVAKAAQLLSDVGIDYDFVDLNMGCPLDPIYKQGAGSGLMVRRRNFQSVVRSMTQVLGQMGKSFTVKTRTGVKCGKNFAHELVTFCRDSGVSMMTLHGRTREQRYTKLADWDYIAECAKVADPMPLYGNGDVLSWEEYAAKKESSNVAGVMIGRGALMKPWLFQEIKESRHIDMTSSQRLELIQRYCNYGLEHWGSDSQGVETTRKFLLEWLSFYHRYIPHGILVNPPQRIHERPPRYVGRDEMETLLSSANANDWIKISEMFLGPVPDSFVFVPKHKANSWA